jgi:hypothetical protein
MPKPSQGFAGYVCLSATFWDDPDIEDVGIMPAALYLMMACRIRQLRSDGWITEQQVAKLGHPKWRECLTRLLGPGLVTAHTNSHGAPAYYLPAYLKWNFSEAEYEELRGKKARAGRKSQCVARHGPDCGCWQREPTGV